MSATSDSPSVAHRRWLVFGLAIVSVAVSMGSLALFGLFMLLGGFNLVHLDASESMRLLFNGSFSVLFFVQHSGMVRRTFRRRLARWIPVGRQSVYAIASGVALLLVVLLWQGPMTMLWSAEGPMRWAARGLFVLGGLLLVWGELMIVQADPFGWRALRRRSEAEPRAEAPLIQVGPYRWVRHPQYLATLLMIWSGPDLTTDRLAFNVLWSAWILIGTRWEERDLLDRHGQAYQEYQTRVPMLLPRLQRRRS